MIFLAVKREERYSPNRSISDKAMMDAACSALKEQDDMIFKMQEYEFGSEGVDDPGTFDAVLHMCRSEKALVQLDAIEKSGVTVVNRPAAVRNCRRSNEVRLLSGTDANFVVSRVVSGGEFPDDWNSFPCWLKRGDTHAIDSDDVCFAATSDEASAIMKNISAKGSGEVVLQEYVPTRCAMQPITPIISLPPRFFFSAPSASRRFHIFCSALSRIEQVFRNMASASSILSVVS